MNISVLGFFVVILCNSKEHVLQIFTLSLRFIIDIYRAMLILLTQQTNRLHIKPMTILDHAEGNLALITSATRARLIKYIE